MFIFPKFTECDINDNTYSENEPQSHFRISIRTSELDTDSLTNSLYPTICYSAFEDIIILTIKTRLMCVCVSCNELIEETASRRNLIFGMWDTFGYGSTKF